MKYLDEADKLAHYNSKISKERAQIAQPQVVAAKLKQQEILRKMRDDLLKQYLRINIDAIDTAK